MASPPRVEATLHHGFRAPGERPGRAISGRKMIFDRVPPDRLLVDACVPLGRHLPRAATEWPTHAAEAVKGKVWDSDSWCIQAHTFDASAARCEPCEKRGQVLHSYVAYRTELRRA